MKKSILIILTGAVLLSFPGASPLEPNEEELKGPPAYWIEPDGDGTINYFDRNDDGIADYTITFDSEGKRIHEAQDYNFDGIMDDFYFYEEGQLVRREVDSNFDGEINLRVELVEGIYVRKYEYDSDFDGRIDVVKDYDKN